MNKEKIVKPLSRITLFVLALQGRVARCNLKLA